ncbi:MAG: glycoside hydrolase family 5 protein [Polyangiales bacterium]
MTRPLSRLLVASVMAVIGFACGDATPAVTGGSGGTSAAGASGVTVGGAAAPGGVGGQASGGSMAVDGPGSAGGGGFANAGSGGGGGGVAGVGAAGIAAPGGAASTAGASGATHAAGAAAQSGGAGAAGTSGTGGELDAGVMASAMGFGTNIGNTLENTTSWETGWGQPLITRAFIDGMASRGIKTVRVPVAWDTYATSGKIDSTKLARVKEVVGWIEAAGMYAIVNIHWDGGWIFSENQADAYTLTDSVKTKFADYWNQIASGFSDVGHQLILEGLNEEGRFYEAGDPNGVPDLAALNELNQLFVTTVRAVGGYNTTRALLIAGFHTDIAKTCVDAFAVPTDPAGAGKLLLSIHFYDPYTFTLMEDPESWGSPQASWGTDAEKKAVEDLFSELGAFSTSKQIPVILGEFAVTRGTKVVREPAARSTWMEVVANAALSRGMVPVLWDTGTDIARSDGAFSSELQAVMDNLRK